MDRYIAYGCEALPPDLTDGDKVWRIVNTLVQVFDNNGRLSPIPFDEERLFVASLNVDKKFKVYHGDFGAAPKYVAEYGRKLQWDILAERLFPKLVAVGWKFTV